MLRDSNRDGRAEPAIIVARRTQMHGVAIEATKVYLVTVKELFVTDRKADGTFGPLQRLGRAPRRAIRHTNITFRSLPPISCSPWIRAPRQRPFL